ncbi:R3H and coiled-coil domain-containing protein 1, partial [Aulostomus maculatus]
INVAHLPAGVILVAGCKFTSVFTLAFPCFDGIYLPKQENEFVHHVTDELEAYQQRRHRKSVLLFPPLPSRLRYLIHRITEDLPELTTFSVGESWCRRVVVCPSELRGEVQNDSDFETNTSVNEEPLRSKELEGKVKPKSSVSSRSRGPKRPDKALYMPRAARERLHLQKSQEPSGDQELARPASGCVSDSSDCGSVTTLSPSLKQESPRDVGDNDPSQVVDGSVCHPAEEEQHLVLRLHEDESLVWERTISSFSNITLDEDVNEEDDLASVPCSSTTEDTSTDSDDDLAEEIKTHLKEAVTVSIEHVHNDFSIYENVCVNPDEFRHVIEIYGFSPMLKTEDLLDAFSEHSNGGMKIKWVDNTHALGVFSSESAALQALSICHPLLKTRALADGSKKSKGKAIRRAEFIQPVKERPRTDCAVARRMVTRALGLQGRGRVQQY